LPERFTEVKSFFMRRPVRRHAAPGNLPELHNEQFAVSLSPSSSIVIDLLLLSDAVTDGNLSDVRRLARRIHRTAGPTDLPVVASHAREVEALASDGVDGTVLALATCRLLRESEREIHEQAGPSVVRELHRNRPD